ncbi:Putative CENP-V/GFA domain, Mss4-like superfamily protein [Septoria linicola]|uniref:CENP-V/GFA domain, Mss4-like superfamily protein n=1 Tax=Septoria linicola TaxID=215465 RepID=A0A9Q9ELE1_9PEZI|nr:putative CENP-V/GFA domain, Mss4-like superfamily protein [Septoria linicola]USW55005.1 Putative CENP-V/GFA domain, Mss4-like superfamily protein [Septoria linicola]
MATKQLSGKRAADGEVGDQSPKHQKQSSSSRTTHLSDELNAEMKRDISGGCHCGFVKYIFTASMPLSGNRCNCTFCQKCRTTNYSVENGSANFQLISPKTKDDPKLGNYAPKVKTAARYFCKDCGVHVWMEGYYEYEGQKVDLFMVNLATVDQPQEGVDLRDKDSILGWLARQPCCWFEGYTVAKWAAVDHCKRAMVFWACE